MYIIFNKDGSVSESQLTDYINQHSDGVNYIDISIVGKSVDEYTADGNFKLPNKEVVSLVGSFTNKIKTSTGVYEGYRITLSAVVTEYQGDVALSIQVYNADKTTLFTYPVTLYVNETTGRGGDHITQDQYEALRSMMADYQLQYARSNMRSYDTLVEATEDLPNLSNGQMILAKETADSETSAVFQKVGDKLEGVSLDGLAVDKFLRKHNAKGTGTFTWTDETEGGNVDFEVNATATKVYEEVFGIKTLPMMEISGNPMYEGNSNGTKLTLYSYAGDTAQYADPQITLVATNKGYGTTFTPFYIAPPVLDGKKIWWFDSSKAYIYKDNSYLLSSSHMGVANGVASLDNYGKIPTSQLPSYVSDVAEYPTLADFPDPDNPKFDPITGKPILPEVNKIYIALDTNKTYRWGGTVYVEIGSSLALGETSETAYAGDKGKRNADNIATLQSGKLDRKGSGLPYGYAFYVAKSDGPTSTPADTTLLATQHPNTSLQVPMTDVGGALFGRTDQTTNEPQTYELITREYADNLYGKLSSGLTNEWASNNVFKEAITVLKEIPTGTDIEPAKINFKTSSYNSDTPSYIGGDGLNIYIGVKGSSSSQSFNVYKFASGGRVVWRNEETSKSYILSLPSKSGTIALTSDLSEAGTSVTIRRW